MVVAGLPEESVLEGVLSVQQVRHWVCVLWCGVVWCDGGVWCGGVV